MSLPVRRAAASRASSSAATGHTFSGDGVQWSPGEALIVSLKGKGFWADGVRTAWGLMAESGNKFTLLDAGCEHVISKFPATLQSGGTVALVTLKLISGKRGN